MKDFWKAVWTIFKREVRSQFSSPIAREIGPSLAVYGTAATNAPSPTPRSTERSPSSLPTTRSGTWSPSRSLIATE